MWITSVLVLHVMIDNINFKIFGWWAYKPFMKWVMNGHVWGHRESTMLTQSAASGQPLNLDQTKISWIVNEVCLDPQAQDRSLWHLLL